MFSLKQSSLTLGKRDPQHLIVTSSYVPDDSMEAQYGSVFFTFVLKDHRELAAELKNIIIECFKQHFYQDLDRNPEQSFEETLQVVNDSVLQLTEAEGIVWQESLSIALGVFSQSDLHLSVGGMGSVYLVRGQHITLISEGLVAESNENKIFHSLASGNLLANDHILLSTEKLDEIVDMGALKNKIKGKGDDEVEIPSLQHAHVQVIECRATTTAPTMVEEPASKEKPVVGHAHATSTTNVGNLSSASRLVNTLDILKENLQKSLERIFNRDRPLVRKGLPLNKIIAGALVVIVVIGGIYWFSAVQQSNAAKKDLQNLLTQVSRDREEAKTRLNIDRESAKNLLVADQKKLNDALATTSEGILVAQIRGELGEIKQLLETADRVYRVDNPKVAYDLSKERSNFEGKGLVRLNNDLYAFDSDAIYRLAMDKPTRRTVIVNGNTVNELQLATAISKENSIELYTKDHQLVEFKNDTFSLIKAPGTEETSWKNAVDITEYSDRKFMYFLDPAGNTVWRYGRDSAGFQAPVSKNVAQLPMEKAVSIAVDGAVYILSSDGKIYKTYADEKKDFIIDGLTDPFNEPTKILADKNPDSGVLYVLDAKNQRIVVLSKSGKYQEQYVFADTSDLLDIELLPGLTKDQLMVMTASGKVFQIELKSLSN
ncbi:MAG: hypothetical protein HY817_00515 [Candidatus Abawacabacteria bacterium]|nr:hypothetical protein [Candidatus Abawacabacteria bacterium]